MRKLLMQDGDKQIIYNANERGEITDTFLLCVMCNDSAFFIAKETDEPLCLKCKKNNDEARRMK